MKTILILLFLTLTTASLRAQGWLENLDRALTLATPDPTFRTDLSGLLDLELYVPETPAMGLLDTDDEVFFNPRLILFLYLQATEHLRAHLQMRTDRGFDPGFAADGQTRLDEYFVEWKPTSNDLINFRLGKFATAFGSWTERRLSWENPFITAPMAYNDMLPVSDDGAVPLAGFLNRRFLPDNRRTWLPLIWGPSYASGASVFGQLGPVDYAFEIKNASLSSAPRSWDVVENGWDSTTYTGRLGWRPAPEWNLGGSFSHGPYLMKEAQSTLPAGSHYRDFDQTTFGLDAAWSHGAWQVWSELMTSRFEVPNVGGVRVFSGFLETKYKLNSQWWIAGRWNQSWFGNVPGTGTAWDLDGWRADVSVGYRFSRQFQAKLQYSIAERSGRDEEGNHFLAAQITVKF
ncbi:hypothetical protein SAMN02745166_00011 [Prosthecobacter debontii]|uniref:Phosphate-selective porin O and P n=1 Tax=Prosthecobacter debontii TaxID=48467 RepID=A0A1T4WDJ3_9BACT|nr:hypothetical protein [Prosthecobacter debontii]SKA75384.1 hypothetical protein SAMN02745166_00011 [Prosthecobacter debontii]